MGLGVSNEELSNALHQGQMGQVLFPGGKFIGEQDYEMLIQSQFNLSVAQFEQEVKGRDRPEEAAFAHHRPGFRQRQGRQRRGDEA